MATYHLQVRVGRQGGRRAEFHFDYVTRTGRYKDHGSAEEIVFSKSGNMPEWAVDYPKTFWIASDTYERKRGSVYREIEAALPREISMEKNIKIVEWYIKKFLGDRHTYTYGIHIKLAADGLPQPHVHLFFSERENDEIYRDPDQYFKRAAASPTGKNGIKIDVDPANGGCRKAKMNTLERLLEFRQAWADRVNAAYVQLGLSHRVSHRSLKDQQIDRMPEKHVGPSRFRKKEGDSLRQLRTLKEAEAEALHEAKKLMARSQTKQKFEATKPYLNHQAVDPSVRDGSPSAHYPNKTRWQMYREQILEDHYGVTVGQTLTRFWKISRTHNGLLFENKAGCFRDLGGQIVGQNGDNHEVSAMIQLAKIKGWDSIAFTGTNEYKRRAMRAALASGLSVLPETDQDRGILQALSAETDLTQHGWLDEVENDGCYRP